MSARAKRGLIFKGAIAIAQEHADAGGVKICGDHVEFTIAIHIAQSHGGGLRSRGEGGLRCKRKQGGNGWQAYEVNTK